MSTAVRNSGSSLGGRRFGVMRKRYGLVLAWLAVFLLAAIAIPGTFLTVGTLAGILGSQTVLVFLGLGILFPLTAGDYDLSIGGTVSLTSIILAILNVQAHIGIGYAIVLTLVLGAVIGAVNGILVVGFRIDPFIVTLGMATILGGLAIWFSNSNTLTGVSDVLPQWTAINVLLSIPLAFYYGIVAAVLVWYLLGYATFGRRLLYIGRGREVARLNGVSVGSCRFRAFVISGTASAMAGVVYVGTTGSASPSSGTSYLLPAYAAAFLGATAIIPGRYNAWGTVVAVYFLGTGITAITLLGAESYVQSLFYGGALIVAVILSQLSRGNRSIARLGSTWFLRKGVRSGPDIKAMDSTA